MGKHYLRQVACVLAAVLTSIAACGVASGATDPAVPAPPTVLPLSGEGLNSTSFTRISRTCNPDGSGEISFSATGLATGPYTGTFTESGTITYGPRDPLSEDSVVTSAEIDFTIDSASPPATITGHKSIGPTTRAQSFARCDLLEFGEGPFTSAVVFALPYTATIETLDAVCTTSGTAYTEVVDFDVAPPFEPNHLREDFNPDGTPPMCSSTTGKATGGGYIDPLTGEAVDLATMLIQSGSANASVNDKGTFGFTVQRTAGDAVPKGNLSYDDHGAGETIKVSDWSLLQIRNSTLAECPSGGLHATMQGVGEENGTSGHSVRVEVDDCGEPGSGAVAPDRFEIHVDEPAGYFASGVLVGGNIQVTQG